VQPESKVSIVQNGDLEHPHRVGLEQDKNLISPSPPPYGANSGHMTYHSLHPASPTPLLRTEGQSPDAPDPDNLHAALPKPQSARVVHQIPTSPTATQGDQPLLTEDSTQPKATITVSGSRAISADQVDVIRNLAAAGVPAPELVGVIEGMVGSTGAQDGNAVVALHESEDGGANVPPPQYENIQTA
jgi:hypothetical protein